MIRPARLHLALLAAAALLLAACGQPEAASAPLNAAPNSILRSQTAEGYHTLGPDDAPVTIVAHSDFLCTACRFHAQEIEPQIIRDYVATGKARLVYRYLIQLGEGSARTAEAAECAAEQRQFWAMHDALFERQNEVYAAQDLDSTLQGFARDLGLDADAFASCLQSDRHVARIRADHQAAEAAGIRSRPVLNINGHQIVGAQPFAVFQQAIEEALSK